MVSSLNHHISLLKLTVHGAYVEFLTSGRVPDPWPTDPAWSSPRLQRTPWYDLLDCAQRVNAFRALWAVTAFLTRDVDGGEGF
jgi:hypothetical protein